MIIPAASIAAGLVDFAIAFGLLVVLMFYFGTAASWTILLLPVPVMLTVLLALGVGLWMSALNVKYRDIRHALPFVIQLWMFASPIIYPASIVPAKWKWVLQINPLTGIIEGYRASIFGLPFDWPALAVSAAMTFGVLTYSAYAFRRMERTFADII
jgi:lipopolysaccharide transport system permease protein